MKAPLAKRSTASRFSLIFVLLFTMAAWTFSISAAQQQDQSPPQGTDQSPAPQSVESVPAPAEQNLNTELPAAQQPSGETASGPACPPEYAALIQKTTASLLAANFTFYPMKALDPFVPFVSLEPSAQARSPEDEEEPQNGAPMTPLQKMTMSEIERGLKAITWGELGKKAVIEDSTGRGYIVGVGTPAGEHSGVITQILNDRLVIQQEIWDRKTKKRFPQDFTIKLVKKTDQKS